MMRCTEEKRSAVLHKQEQLLSAAVSYGACKKYRKPVLRGGVRDLVYQIIRDVFSEKGLNILDMNGGEDHVHVLFEADPYTTPGELVNVVKTKTSRFARKQFGETELKKHYWRPLFWSDSYFITTVSEKSLETVQAYNHNQ